MRRACAAVALLCAACSEGAEQLHGEVYSLIALAGAARSVAPEAFTARGAPLALLSPPYAPEAATQAADADGLTVFPAFVDARPAAYVTTEIWDQFPRVWAQPVYQLVTAVGPIAGPTPLAGALPIFSIPPGSRFYSPFWTIEYVIVPAGFSGSITSVAAVMDSGFPVVPGPNVYRSVSPSGLGLSRAAGTKPLRPLTFDGLVNRLPQQGWLAGAQISYLDWGTNRFRIDDRRVVQETALYEFALRGPDGNPVPLNLPRVGGTGAFRAPRPVDAPNGVPQFGALWHEYTAMLATRPGDPLPGIFIPKALTALRALMAAKAGAALVPLPGNVAEDTPERDQFILRVAVDGTCFSAGDFPFGCAWLDTQVNIENNLPAAAFIDQKRFSANALLFFDGGAL